MADDDADRPKQPTPPPLEFVRPGEGGQSSPGTQQPEAAWVPRPEDYMVRSRPMPGVPAQPAGTNRHLVAGLLLIVGACIAIADTVNLSVVFYTPAQYANLTANVTASEYALSQICGLLAIFGQVTAFLAGIMAIQRLNWKLAALSSVFALATVVGVAVLFFDLLFGVGAVAMAGGLFFLFVSRANFLS